jgi:cold shock CspA family protein
MARTVEKPLLLMATPRCERLLIYCAGRRQRGPVFAFLQVQAKGFKSLQVNQKVSFDVKQGSKGRQAANIQPQ